MNPANLTPGSEYIYTPDPPNWLPVFKTESVEIIYRHRTINHWVFKGEDFEINLSSSTVQQKVTEK